MAMNRETKRALQKRGDVGEDGAPKAPRRSPAKQPPAARTKEERTSPRQFLREVRAELRKVVWPTKAETINYSVVVFITVVVLTAFIALLDFASSKAVLWIFSNS
jgi:preprotein translocase subunit SecE